MYQGILLAGEKWKEPDETSLLFKEWQYKITESEGQELKDILIEILTWGGVIKKNKQRIENREDWRHFLNRKKKEHKLGRYFLEDLNPNHINAAFTKIYAASDNRWLMYDSRVGAAMGLLVKAYLKEKNRNNVPPELAFGWANGVGKRNRNPNESDYVFPNFQYNRTIHYQSNLMMNWLLFHPELVRNYRVNNEASEEDTAFAIQSGLFMLGQEI